MSVMLEKVKRCVEESDASRCMVYKDINPTLSMHSIYHERQPVNEFHRLEFSRFRLSGHILAIETGRWNRRGRGRLPVEERLCPCGEVQTELHVVESCVLTQPLREHHRFTSWHELMAKDARDAARIVHLLLSTYQ